MAKQNNHLPSVFVVFGATGNLAKKKIFPSLFHLFEKDKLPKSLYITGFSRRDWDDDKFREYVTKILVEHQDASFSGDKKDEFLKLITYQKGNFENLEDFKNLAEVLGRVDDEWQACSNKLFYLAVPPKYYEVLFNNLDKSGLTEPCSPEEGWTRVIVEKPFGKDLESAKRLDKRLSELFKEEQIYRIDHYLGKEMLQNILAFRFSNNIFENSWNNKYIEKIEVKLLEKGGIEDRGTFYDGVGALRDVGQNHLLQMLSLATMENPINFDADSIREKRQGLLSKLKAQEREEVKNNSFRAQYEGYRDEDGVVDDSTTETYFKVRGGIDLPKWRGVEVTLEGGKKIGDPKKEIVVFFKHPSPCLCPPGSDHTYQNKVIFALHPNEEITFRLWSKKPGFSLDVEKRSFDLPYRSEKEKDHYTEEYEKLLLDCFMGDQTLFVSTKEVESMWRFTDPIVKAWRDNEVDLEIYKQESVEIRKKADQSFEKEKGTLKREVGIVGLGKMGASLSRQLMEKGWRVVGYNRTYEVAKEMEEEGIESVESLEEFKDKLEKPRVVWSMVPAGEPTNETVEKLSTVLEEGDVVIDGGNSFYKDSIENSKKLEGKGIKFVDVGVSGGPDGARHGACLMVGGEEDLYEYLLPLFIDISVAQGHEHFEGAGAGHFVKMVHNGIEYGMMQSIAEGFDILKNSDYKLHLEDVAEVYNHGSVIESRLIDWMREAFEVFGDELEDVSGAAGGGGKAPGEIEGSEGAWSVKVAHVLGVEDEVIHQALKAREESIKDPDFQGKIINALRNRFGGHSVNED